MYLWWERLGKLGDTLRIQKPELKERWLQKPGRRGLQPKGTDIRLDFGQRFRPEHLPRSNVWKAVRGWPWRSHQHINALEMLARPRARRKSVRESYRQPSHDWGVRQRTKFLTSVKLHTPASQQLAASLRLSPLFGWVASEVSPAERPSRWFAQP